MNNYYFTESKWYGPLGMTDPDFVKYKTPKHEKVYLDKWNNRIQELLSKGPSGDSLIPEFAGMVKEENKDFKWRYEYYIPGYGWKECSQTSYENKPEPFYKKRKNAVPVAEEINKEEQAEWEFLTIIKANYEISKRSDGSEWKGYNAKAAVLETYEDLIELIKGLPLKRENKSEEGKQTFSE